MRRAASRALAVLAAAVTVGTALVHGQVSDAGLIERVTLRSGSYTDFRQVFAREAPAGVSVPATLRYGTIHRHSVEQIVARAHPRDA